MGLAEIGNAIGNGIQNLGAYTGQAAANANAISKMAQSAQGLFNQNSANLANQIESERLAQQYAFNAAQAEAANEFTREMWEKSASFNEAMNQKNMDYNTMMWDAAADYNTKQWEKTAAWNEAQWNKSAAWNEMMYGKQEAFNREEAQKNRDFQKEMASTAYQRAVADMEKAGLNPILAVTSGINTNSPGGSTASIGGSNMGYNQMSQASMGASGVGQASIGSAQGYAAQGGIVGANSASESNYIGQMEYLSGELGLISAIIGSATSAVKEMGTLGDIGKGLGETLAGMFSMDNFKNPNTKWNQFKKELERLPDKAKYYADRWLHPEKYK